MHELAFLQTSRMPVEKSTFKAVEASKIKNSEGAQRVKNISKEPTYYLHIFLFSKCEELKCCLHV